MSQELKPPLPRSRRVAPLAALAFIVAVLLLFNFSNWHMMRLLETSKEEDLTRRVRSVTKVVSQSLAFPAPPAILSNLRDLSPEQQAQRLDAYPDTDEYERLTRQVAELKAGSGLAQILVLTPNGFVVVDSNYRFLTGEPLPFTIDTQFLLAALNGEAGTTPLYAWEGEHFQRDYQPLPGNDGTTVGVVMGSISADYLQSLEDVRTQVIRMWVVTSVLLALMGFWLYQMFRYVARLERRALQKVRVEAMGALAGGMAHELRNPLAIIRALAEEIEADQPQANRSTENARDIVAETQRLSDLVTHFLSLSRSPEDGGGQPVNINDEINRVVQLMQKSASSGVEFITDLPSEPLFVRGDERAVRQLLLNLLVNAREALGENKGRVVISLREKRNLVELRVADTGPGISRRVLARAFEPFYTTKANGTGLGLAISRGIAENLGGQLALESMEGRGATAIVSLPLAGVPGEQRQ